MDKNTELLLLRASQSRQWEHEERASYDIQTLKAEFRKRLYAVETKEKALPETTRDEKPARD